MELRQYLAILQRRWWMFLLGLVAGALAAYSFSRVQPPLYQAQSTLLLNLAQQQSSVPTLEDVSASQALTKTYARIITAQPTLEEAATRLGGGLTYKSLKKVSGTDVPQTELITASFESADPQFAAQVVNTVSAVFSERVREAQIGTAPPPGAAPPASANINTIYVVEPALVPTSPVSPRIAVNTIVGGVLGLLAAISIVALLEYLDDTVKEPADLEHLHLTVMGVVQRFPARREAMVTLLDESNKRAGLAEEYQQLQTNTEFAGLDGEIRTLLVTSAQPREGKTTTAVNLAITAARAGRRVLLVDTDLRRPSIHRSLRLPNKVGLTTVLLQAHGAATLGEALQQVAGLPALSVMTTGPLPPNPAEVLASKHMVELIQQLSQRADLVIFDTPPSVAVSDAAILAAHVDGVLVVVDTGHTRMSALERALDNVLRSRTRVIGVVLNKVSRYGKGYQGYHYYYSSGEETRSSAVTTASAQAGDTQSLSP